MDKVLLIGEPMELLLAEEEGALSDVTHFRASVSGAEMNVAVGLARSLRGGCKEGARGAPHR